MKKFYLILATLFFATVSFASPVITAKKNDGKWSSNATWTLGRTPVNGDTVIIPAGIRVVLDNTQNLQAANLYIKIFGQLDLDGGKLKISDQSNIILYSGASIIGHGNNSEQIQMGSVFKFRGTDLIIAGPAHADATTGSSPTGFISGTSTLPVKFIGFNAARQNNNVLIDWSTAQEENSSHFDVERSFNGASWTTIGTVTSVGNSSTVQKYAYTDRGVTASVVYYRVKQVDLDGHFEYTVVRSVKMDNGSLEVTVAAGSGNNVYIHFSQQVNANVVIRVSNMNGQVLNQQVVSNPVGQQIINSRSNMTGIHVVTITSEEGLFISKKVLF